MMFFTEPVSRNFFIIFEIADLFNEYLSQILFCFKPVLKSINILFLKSSQILTLAIFVNFEKSNYAKNLENEIVKNYQNLRIK